MRRGRSEANRSYSTPPLRETKAVEPRADVHGRELPTLPELATVYADSSRTDF